MAMESFFQKIICEKCCVIAPFSINRLLFNPLFKIWLDLCKINEDVLWRPNLWGGCATFFSFALRVYQVNSIEQFSTAIALITSSVKETAQWTSSSHKSISQESFAWWAILLLYNLFVSISLFFKIQENLLANLCLLLCRSSSKGFHITVEPLINAFVNSVILVTNLLWSHTFRDCFGFGCRSILISTTNVNCVITHESSESRVNISWENATDDVT